ncbi:oligosaccharide flippase family protein [Thiothrix subterranea]|uniref:Oligosaccharide flippase family protein n=1 Tax=Thiothrix subterranea TaxID=2735563 RepID=A0AA51MT10_9GAMM|nr:oligosaccharide flippase family protein [Thiothrix subterranea]MDQ5767220.1 oligosaccharide flippase family protein [Thiothrix subterranea]WML87917.1 oligosaccharide flippase family protein [Thiothrix subterranea]
MKNISRNIAFSGLGYVLPLLASLATIPLMIKYMGTDVYGLYIICISLIGFMNFVDLGVGQAIVKYVSQYEVTGENTKIKPILDIALLMYVVLGIVIAVAVVVFALPLGNLIYNEDAKAELAAKAFSVTAVAFLLSYINQFFLNVFKAYHRFDVPAVIQNSANIAGIVMATGMVLLGYDLIAILWGYVIIQAIALVSGYTLGRQVLPPGVKLGLSFDQRIFAEMIGFSAYTFVSNFLGGVVSRLDKFIIGWILGTEAVTYYQIPHTIAQMANGIIQVLSQITFPRFSELSSLNDQVGRLALYRRAMWLVFLFSMAISVALISSGGAFLELWISPEFALHSTLTLQIIALYFFFQSNTVVAYWVLQGSGNAKVTAISSFLGTVAYVAGMYVLTPRYGHDGAALSLFLLLLPLPYFYWWVQRNVGHKFGEYLLQTLLFVVLGMLIILLLNYVHEYINSNLLVIVTDGVVLMGVVGAALLYLFRETLRVRFR